MNMNSGVDKPPPIVCFFGHRDAPPSLRPRLAAVVNHLLMANEETRFYVGGCGAFDRMAAGVVREHKLPYPAARLVLVPAYLSQLQQDPATIRDSYDEVLFPALLETVPPRCAIPRRNRWLAEQADIAVAYVCGPGGARTALQAAERLGAQIIRLI